jgi:SAM-dependent methyltransferase
MVRLSSEYTGQMTRFLRFEDMDYVDEFDGIWACASLLHVSRVDLPDVFRRLERALKKGGLLYASFKVGSDYSENGRDFVSFNEEEITEFIRSYSPFTLIESVLTSDVRKQVSGVKWINLILIKES